MQETRILPQFSDSDALGHINHISLIRWYEVARSPLYRFLFPNFSNVDELLVLVHIDIDFIAEMQLDMEALIQTEITKIGNTSFTMSQEAWQDGKLCGRGNFVIVYFDLVNRKPLPIDDDFRQKLEYWSNGELG